MTTPIIISSGTVDPSFSADGVATTALTSGHDQPTGVAVQADGKILVVGKSGDEFALVRYTADGRLDTGFSSDGIVTTGVGSGVDTAEAVALQSDGRILVAGYSASAATGDDFALVRYNPDGSLDSGFGSGGMVVSAIASGSGLDQAHSLAVQADGKIVLVGHNNLDFEVVRYNIDGSLDASFDGDGTAVTSIANSSDYARALAVQPDGKILVAGYGYNFTAGNWDVVLARYNADGALDTSFDGDGKAIIDLGGNEYGYDVALDGQGRIVVAGEIQPAAGGPRDIALWRLTSAGSLDTSFGGGDGLVTLDFAGGNDGARAVALQADGKILVGGSNSVNSGQAVLLRYDASGDLDASFDGDGVVARYFGSGTSNIAALAFAPDGALVAAGSSYSGESFDFGVMRLGALSGVLVANAANPFAYTVPASAFFDPDGGDLAFSASLAGGGALPSWLSFNPATRAFSGTPGTADFRALLVGVTASDGSGSTSAVFELDVTSYFIDSLMYASGARWNAQSIRGTPVEVTYSFMSAAPSYSSPSEMSTFEAFNATQQAAAAEVLGLYAGVANISFVAASDAGDGGQIRFGRNEQDASTAGYANAPGTSAKAGDIWIDKTDAINSVPSRGSYGYEVLTHEVGHALGLKHPFEGGVTLPAAEETRLYSVMSYTDPPNRNFREVTQLEGGGYTWSYTAINPETPMIYDIAAIQYLYGANTSAHAGNDTYTFDPAQPFFKTIWDGGGIDSIDISNFGTSSTIDLRDGHYSTIRIPSDPLPPGESDAVTDIYDGTNNLGIAFDAVIENAVGGAGDDQIIGNASPNALDGAGGADTLQGDAADDRLRGGAGSDVLHTGAGRDLAEGGADQDTLVLTPDGTWSPGYRAWNVGTPGNSGTNQLVDITGKLRYEDVLDGGGATDALQLSEGADAFFLHDAYSGMFASVSGQLDFKGMVAAARLISVESIYCGGGDDVVDLTSPDFSAVGVQLFGEAGNDILWGAQGDDSISGGSGNDVLFGGAGYDSLTGGAGNDLFQYSAGDGIDSILDFLPEEDKLQLFGATALDEVSIISHSTASGTLLSWNANSITLLGVDLAAPSSDWIVFG